VLRINYTTYDLCCAQDSLNPRVHADIMVLANEESQPGELAPHPYWYACIVGIFHVYVRYLGGQSRSRTSQRIDFLWVHWFCRDSNHNSGWAAQQLHRIGFFDAHEVGAEAFGFIDPHHVIRVVHLIPAYNYHYMHSLLPPSIARQPCELNADFCWYYVNQCIFFFKTCSCAHHDLDLSIVICLCAFEAAVSDTRPLERQHKVSMRTEMPSTQYLPRRKANVLGCSMCQDLP